MPPPNITGQLHMGHALFATLQDTLTRTKRLRGYDTLWQPGTDHAGIATHEKIMASLAQEGCFHPDEKRYQARAQEWRTQHQNTISDQLRLMGASCDWSRERYTLDDGMKRATIEAFCRLYEQGLIFSKDGQWYMDLRAMAKDLKQALLNNTITIEPAHERKTLLHFLDNIEPWCLSRQIPWGHRMPLWSDENGNFTAARDENDARRRLKTDRATQITDSLDTWFSSSLWPFAILGWPNPTSDMERFYPASLIETGADILFPWCAKMLMMGKALTGIYPFATIYLHGMIRDEHGRKMSKSLGNGIDPRTIIDSHGCDALRLALLEHNSAGQDLHLSRQDFDSTRHLTNKLWQAARFFERHWERAGEPFLTDLPSPGKENQGFLIALHQDCEDLLSDIEAFSYKEAAFTWRRLIKERLCDTFIEDHKDRLYQDDLESLSTGLQSLQLIIRAGFPMCPFITERIAERFSFQPLHTL